MGLISFLILSALLKSLFDTAVVSLEMSALSSDKESICQPAPVVLCAPVTGAATPVLGFLSNCPSILL
ncbi:hypothetical protein D3C87_1886780 [compost metagenome]